MHYLLLFPHHIINKRLDFVYCFLIMACIIFCLYWIECCYVYNRIVTIMPYTFPYTFKYWLIPNCTRIIGRGHNCTRISCYSWLYVVYVHACTTKVKWKNKQQTVLVFSYRLYNNISCTPLCITTGLLPRARPRKITRSWDLGTSATRKYNESVEVGEKLNWPQDA